MASGSSAFQMPNILFLNGVYMRDCKDVGDMMADRLSELVAFETSNDQKSLSMMGKDKYDKIQILFVSADTWPYSTNIACWQCSCSFSWEPVFIPHNIMQSDTVPEEYMPIKAEGNFCSFPCAGEWVRTEVNRDKRWDKIEMLKLLHFIITGQTIVAIPSVPKKTSMVQYGGHLTISQYQAKLKNICVQYRIKFPFGLFRQNTTAADASDVSLVSCEPTIVSTRRPIA